MDYRKTGMRGTRLFENRQPCLLILFFPAWKLAQVIRANHTDTHNSAQ
jgi:hypothetical protein